MPAPNGVDDTAAFNAAIAQTADGTVAVPGSGTYLVRAVTVNRANTTIVCTGTPAATIKLKALASGDGSPALDVRAGGFTLRNCVVDGNRAAQPAGGFNDSFTGRSYRAGLKMDGGALAGLTVEGATFRNVYGAAIAPRNVSDVRVTNSVFRDNNFEAVFSVSPYVSGDPSRFIAGFSFVGNTVTNARSRDAAVNANGLVLQQTSNLYVENNVWDGFERNAMKLENCRLGNIANNRISNGDLSWAGIGLQNGSHYMTVSGNVMTNVGSGIDTSLVVNGQFTSDTVDHLTIDGNTINSVHSGSMPDGIRILGYGSATTDVVITNNVIKNVPRYGINLRQFTTQYATPTFARITIQNNQLTAAGGCTNFFASTVVAPSSTVTTPNTCG
ncbi:MAG: right-handed parallel beta-helix repeat-containing protein [Anaeromyxobacteraceae bacterium]